MNRYAFYLIISLLAFGIGITSFLFFYQQKEISQSNKFLRVEEIEVSNSIPTHIQTVASDEDEICSGLDAEDYFEPAIKKWLKEQKIEEKPIRPPKEYQSEGDKFIPSLIDVNHDGRKELMIKWYCSPTKNCAVYIFEKKDNDYRRLFFSCQKIQAIHFGKSSYKGYQEIQTTTKLNEKTGFYSTYKFNGEYYDTTKCFQFDHEKNKKEDISLVECYMVEDEIN
ncbi:MAG: hypothetical protein K1X72_25915 [Pyrinomonadaceae bacterium]|nr:hypothetical protein [Pyrinomonadaceae bacterium]